MTAWLLMLAVSAGLSMNLVLQLGLGIREIALAERFASEGNGIAQRLSRPNLPLRLSAFFVSALLLWLLFSFARSLLPLGFLEYVLVFPVSIMVSHGWEYLFDHYMPGRSGSNGGGAKTSDVFTGGAPMAATVFVTLAIAGSFVEALVLSIGFMFGTLLAIVVIAEIRRRAQMEAVPRWLRGAPLSIVAMGLLSLVFSFAAIMFFEVLGSG
ncbi:MAG: hypothetical protein FWB78_03185 [Treponema sp.]|nr:hypothetical protein [Treponema sp.]